MLCIDVAMKDDKTALKKQYFNIYCLSIVHLEVIFIRTDETIFANAQ